MIGSSDPTHNLMLSGALILLAMFFDAVDGQVARLTPPHQRLRRPARQPLRPGVVRPRAGDSAGEDVSAVHQLAQRSGLDASPRCSSAAPRCGWPASTSRPTTTTITCAFAGLPTPAAAAAIASFAILSYTLRNEVNIALHEKFPIYDWWMQRLLPLFAVVIAILMVSRIPYPHPLTQFLRGQRSFAHIVAIVFALVAILIVRGYAVPLLCVLFVFDPAGALRLGSWPAIAARAKNRCSRTLFGGARVYRFGRESGRGGGNRARAARRAARDPRAAHRRGSGRSATASRSTAAA